MSNHPTDEKSLQQSKMIKIRIQCSDHLLKKYPYLEEALTTNYFIQATESSESNRTGGQLLFALQKQSNDAYDDNTDFFTPYSSLPTFETIPIAETTGSNVITTSEKFEVGPQQPSESQNYSSSEQAVSDNQANVPTTVSVTNDPSKNQSQKSSHTVFTTGKNLTQGHDSQMVATCPAADETPTELMLHSIYHTVHGSDFCPFYNSFQDCHESFDEEFAYGLDQYLMRIAFFCNQYFTRIPNYYSDVDMYAQCIKEHFKGDKCPSKKCSKLWNFCINNKLYGALKHSRDGLLIHSKYQSAKIGTICMEYLEYHECIGKGGSGKVYKFSLKAAKDTQLALKEEKTRPVIENSKVFEQLIELNSKHVIKMLEYVVGPKDGNQLFLFVMPYMNRGGLHVQFKDENLSCVLDYFLEFPQEMSNIFRNYIIICLHLLRGLQYLEKHGMVHRDIKVSNILVQQNCGCISPLQCNCDGDGGVQYVIGDLNLMCMEDDQSGKGGEWEKMLQHAPAGTIGKIAPELFFKTNQGERFGSHRSDVYSACVTMMEILISNKLHISTHEPIAEFFEAISMSYQAPFTKIQDASKILDQTLAKVQQTAKVSKIKQLLDDSQRYIQQMQAFQGSYVSEIYSEKSPLARILANVYGANILHWTCLQKLPHIYHEVDLWNNLQIVLDAIKDGVKFMPQKRPDATELITRLEVIHPRSKTLFEKSKNEN